MSRSQSKVGSRYGATPAAASLVPPEGEPRARPRPLPSPPAARPPKQHYDLAAPAASDSPSAGCQRGRWADGTWSNPGARRLTPSPLARAHPPLQPSRVTPASTTSRKLPLPLHTRAHTHTHTHTAPPFPVDPGAVAGTRTPVRRLTPPVRVPISACCKITRVPIHTRDALSPRPPAASHGAFKHPHARKTLLVGGDVRCWWGCALLPVAMCAAGGLRCCWRCALLVATCAAGGRVSCCWGHAGSLCCC